MIVFIDVLFDKLNFNSDQILFNGSKTQPVSMLLFWILRVVYADSDIIMKCLKCL